MTNKPYPSSQNQLLHLLVNQARDHALILLDSEGIVIGWLAGAEFTFGYSADEMIDRHFSNLFTPEDQERGVHEHELATAVSVGRAEDDRWQVRKDGTHLWASGVITALRDDSGTIVGFGKVLRDRTDVKAQIEALEKRVETVSKESQKKDLFLSTLAHELRNPLVPLANAVHILHLSQGQQGNLTRAMQIIERQADALRHLVDDLLDLTRIGAGKLRLQREPLNLNEVLERSAESCRPAAELHHHVFEVLLLRTPTMVEGDPGRLQQVFVNLLNNAIKYTQDGGSIWLKATVEENEAVVHVEDNGRGIDSIELPHIFELFTQEESSRNYSEGGLGLGLPLVRELVNLHGGSVQVRSEGKGKGSAFTVRLPLHRDRPSA